MNRQSVFNRVGTHLIQQGKPAYDFDDAACLYRGPEGTKCAIGVLIPNTKYSAAMEGNCASQILHLLPFKTDHNDAHFLDTLQSELHDDPANGYDTKAKVNRYFAGLVKKNAKKIAKKYGLQLPEIAA